MGNFINNHLSPARHAYQFLDDYQETPANASLNITGNFSYDITITPKLGQLNYALIFKGDLTKDPLQNLQGSTFFFYSSQGYLCGKIFGSSANGKAISFITIDPILNTNDVIYISIVLNFDLKQLIIYKNGLAIAFNLLGDSVVGYETISTQSEIGTPSFPTVYNSDITPIILGKALGYNQFEGIVHDDGYNAKCNTAIEVNNTWNQVKDTTTPTLLGNILFLSSRLTSPAKNILYKMDENGSNQILFSSYSYSASNLIVNKSNDPLLNSTKISFISASSNFNGFYILDINGGNIQIINTASLISGVCLSNDLTKGIYSAYNYQTGHYDLFSFNFNKIDNTISNTLIINNTPLNSTIEYISLNISNTKILCTLASGNTSSVILYNILTNEISLLVTDNYTLSFMLPRYNLTNTKIGYSQKVLMNGVYHVQIFIMDANGANKKQITADLFDNYFDDFSPDSSKIIYHQALPNGYQIFKANIDGRNRENISGNYNAGYNDSQGNWY